MKPESPFAQKVIETLHGRRLTTNQIHAEIGGSHRSNLRASLQRLQMILAMERSKIRLRSESVSGVIVWWTEPRN